MKILLINRYNFIDGGADRVFFNTCTLLKKHGNEVFTFSSTNEKNFFSDYSNYFVESIDYRNISFFKKLNQGRNYLYNKNASRKLNRLIIDLKPDVAHLHLFYGILSPSILKTLKKNHIPIVITIHDYRLLCPANAMLDRYSNVCEKCKNGNYLNCTFRKCSGGNFFYSFIITIEAYIRKYYINPIKYVDHFIFVSKFSQNKHIEYDNRYKLKSTHLYNFIEETSSRNQTKGDYFLYFGRLSKEKGIKNLILAVKNTNIKLRIIGDGPQRDELKLLLSEVDNVEYLGFKSGNELNDQILNCSFVIVPSEWYENNPMTIVEAFSFGKPVIGSIIGGIPELIQEKTGFRFEAGNVASLKNSIYKANNLNENEYKALSDNCLSFAKENFSEDSYYKSLKKIYNSVINVNK